jgi:hypothetical protein
MFKTKGEFLYLAKVLFVVVIVFLIVSCSSTMKMYSGPELPASQTALVKCGDTSINIVSCDGQKVKSLEFTILPGVHTIEMGFNTPGVGYSSDNTLMDFTAEASHVYVVDRTSQGGFYLANISDRTTGKRVDRNARSTMSPSEKLVVGEQWIKQAPLHPYGYTTRGDAFFAMKRYKDALTDYEKAISLIQKVSAKPEENLLKRIGDTKSLISE